VLLGNGNFVVTWHLGPSAEATRSGDSDGIFCQIYQPSGSNITGSVSVNSRDTNNEWNPSVAALGDSGYVICWQSGLWDTGHGDIYGQIFDVSGNKYGNEFLINSDTSGHQNNPSVLALCSGGFAVFWVNRENKISYQLFSNNYAKIGNEHSINIINKNIKHFNVTLLHNNNIAISWSKYKDTYISILDSHFNQIVSNFKIGKNNFFSDFVKTTIFSDSGFIVCWQDYNKEILGRYLLNEPRIIELNEFILNYPDNDATLNTINPTFRWECANEMQVLYPEEIVYTIILSEEENFLEKQIYSTTADTIFTLNGLSAGQTYFWKVLAKNIVGDSIWSSSINGFFIDHDATALEEKTKNKPESFLLYSNYPNPFNPETTIKYILPADKVFYDVNIKIYDSLGQLVLILINEQQKPGVYRVKWNGQNAFRQAMPSGLYFCVLKASQFQAIQKMLLVK